MSLQTDLLQPGETGVASAEHEAPRTLAGLYIGEDCDAAAFSVVEVLADGVPLTRGAFTAAIYLSDSVAPPLRPHPARLHTVRVQNVSSTARKFSAVPIFSVELVEPRE